MLIIDLDPVLFHWGPIMLTWHGLFLTAGVALGCCIFVQQVRATGLPREPLVELLVWTVIGGYVGARLLHVFVYDWRTYAAQPLRILALHQGGLAWYGALIGGTVAIAAVAHGKKLPFWRLADAAAFGLAAGLIVGRIGCTITGDVCGIPTGGTWGLVYTNPNASVPLYLLDVPSFPAPILMQAANAALLGLLVALQRRPRQTGVIFLIYVIGYSTSRFVISFWQGEQPLLFGLHPTQVVALAIAVSAAGVLAVYRRQTPSVS
jgi:phosphatidylglycerol:prolipoprotein diacylglycerol transferase